MEKPPDSAGPLQWERLAGFKAPLPQRVVKFSLAGVQLKFVVDKGDDRFTAPARSGDGQFILKPGSERYPTLPEVEFSAMSLAHSLGLDVADCELVPIRHVDGVPRDFLVGEHALAVRRFDRLANGGRIHIEDAGQVMGVWGERKYIQGNTETVINMVARFSTDWRADVLEAIRRVVADVLIGNGDNHLKNWSFISEAGRGPLVAGLRPRAHRALHSKRDLGSALRRHSAVQTSACITFVPGFAPEAGSRLDRTSGPGGRPEGAPDVAGADPGAPLTEAQAKRLIGRWDGLDLVSEVRSGVALGPHAGAIQ